MTGSVQSAKNNITSFDPIWDQIKQEATQLAEEEPVLSAFAHSAILNQKSLESAISERIAESLGRSDVPTALLRQAFSALFETNGDILCQAMRSDLIAVYERDPACNRLIEPILFFKGFQALQAHRLANQLWLTGKQDLALYLQSRSSRVYQVDIHPNAHFGHGIMLDHATGIIIGETAVIGNDVSILQNVTLGGTGKEEGNRHPKIGNSVLIGAGAKIIGNIKIGDCAQVAAGSVVVKEVPAKKTVAGVPAKIIGETACKDPARSMQHYGIKQN